MESGKLVLASAPARQRWFVAALLLSFVGLSIHYNFKVTYKENASAFLRWREQLLALENGVDIYQVHTYPNPPIMALILLPLAHLPALMGALCWFYAKVVLTLLTLYWVFRLVETPGRPFPPWAKALVVLLSIRPIMGDLSHGNINLFVLFLVVAALYAYRRGKDVSAGLILGLSIACKVTPLLFVPYFVWKRSWQTLSGCAAGLVLFFVLVPGCFLGQERNLQLLLSWKEKMVSPFVEKGEVVYSEMNNQSLPGLFLRLFTHSPSDSTYIERRDYTPTRYDNWLDLEPRQARLLYVGCMVLFAGLVVWSCRTPTAPRQGWRLPAEFGIVLLGMLLFSERTWKHHCVTLVVPLAVICYYLAAAQPGRALRLYLIGSLSAVVLLMLATTTNNHWQAWDEMSKLAQIHGAYAWAHMILVAALVVLLRQREPERVARNPRA